MRRVVRRASLTAATLLVACGLAHAAAQDAAGGRDAVLAEAVHATQAAQAANQARDLATARRKAAEGIDALLAEDPERDVAPRIDALVELAGIAYAAGDLHAAQRGWERVVAYRERVLQTDDHELQAARASLAVTKRLLGDLPGARALFEQVLETLSRSLPPEHLDLQVVRGNLAATRRSLGDLHGARDLEEQVVDVLARTLPPDHPHLFSARTNLAWTLYMLGDLEGARTLGESAIEAGARAFPPGHPSLQGARLNLATTMSALGDLPGARALQADVLEVYSRSLPPEHPYLQTARATLASTLRRIGDLEGARALQERALEVSARTLPPDHPDLQGARLSLAETLRDLGDLTAARALQEQALEALAQRLPADHPDLQAARGSLAVTLYVLRDLPGARALQEQALEVLARILPHDHPNLQAARANLALTLRALGDFSQAQTLQEQTLEALAGALPPDHPDLQAARGNLAWTISALGDLAGARALQEQVLEVRSRTLPTDHPDLQTARGNLALTMAALGEVAAARVLQEQALEARARSLPPDHPNLQMARMQLAWTIARSRQANADGAAEGTADTERLRCADLVLAWCRAQVRAARLAILESSSREAEERCARLAAGLHSPLAFARGAGALAPIPELVGPAFELSETTRGGALSATAFLRGVSDSTRLRAERAALASASDALAALAARGASSDEFDAARTARDAAERALLDEARTLAGGAFAQIDVGVAPIARRLGPGAAAVAFRSFRDSSIDVAPQDAQRTTRVNSPLHLGAFLVRGAAELPADPDALLTFVDLGPLAPIERAVAAWREALGVGAERGSPLERHAADRIRSAGEDLRARALDPLLPALGESDRLVLVLDDVLHLVPLDALPLAAGDGVLGDRWRIESRATLTELLGSAPPPAGTALVALGGAMFNSEPGEPGAEDLAAVAARPTSVAAILRGGPWVDGFEPLTHTGDEARGIGALHSEVFGDERPALVLEKRKASRAALVELAPRARFLHVATHGWYAPESIRSWSDPEPLDAGSGLDLRMSAEDRIRGMSPMLLCGLALAGANLPEDALGRAPGLITAEEIAALDLSNCELAVLSACDTNAGVRRAGQGVASLQRALQMAGARSVITSLWKVRDEPTKELMLDFYRRLWVEKKPKHQALWEAKTRLREAKDAEGRPLYTVRDWAAWVLTGDPD